MAGLTGIKRWIQEDKIFYLAGMLRVQEALGNNDIEITQELPNLNSGKVKVKESVSNFSFISRAEVGLKIKDRYTFSLSPSIEINSDYKVYGGRASFNIAF